MIPVVPAVFLPLFTLAVTAYLCFAGTLWIAGTIGDVPEAQQFAKSLAVSTAGTVTLVIASHVLRLFAADVGAEPLGDLVGLLLVVALPGMLLAPLLYSLVSFARTRRLRTALRDRDATDA